MQVLVDRARLDRGEHGGRVVRLAAGRDHVDPAIVAVEDDGGAERAMRPDATVELLRERVRKGDRVSDDDHVDVEVRLAEQDVADRAADEVHAVVRVADGRDGVQHRREAVGKLERSPWEAIVPPPTRACPLLGPVPYNGLAPRYRSATASISTRAPDGRPAISTVDRAGGVSPTRSA